MEHNRNGIELSMLRIITCHSNLNLKPKLQMTKGNTIANKLFS
jgi:hypothetical protein